MKIVLAGALSILTITSSVAVAGASQAIAVAQTQGPILPAGTQVALRTTQELTTKGKKLRVGDRFNLEVAEPVSVNGTTVIPVGTQAVGEITTIRNKGMFGKSGLIETRLLYIKAGNRQIRVSGRVDDKGSKNGVGAGVATYATLVGGFLITGTSAVIPAGTMVTGITDEEVPLTFTSATAAPLVVNN